MTASEIIDVTVGSGNDGKTTVYTFPDDWSVIVIPGGEFSTYSSGIIQKSNIGTRV